MHSCLKSLLLTFFTVAMVASGSCVVLAHDIGHDHLHVNDSGLQLAQTASDQRGLGYGRNDDLRVDVDPPLIEHDVIEEVEADIRQTFVATVVDDEELDSVLLYYRYAGETSFSRYVMMQVSFSSTYIAQIPTDPNSYTAIEYYIQARDTSGNRTVRGYTFSPLLRKILPPVSVAENAETTVDDVQEMAEESSRHLPRAVYIVGGVLLLGLIASAANSSDGGSGGGGESCGTDGCRLSLTVNPPF